MVPRYCVWLIPVLIVLIGVAVTLPISRSRQVAVVEAARNDLATQLAASTCLGSWSSDLTQSVTFLRDLTEMATGALALTRAAPAGLPIEMAAAFVAQARRSLAVRQRRDTVVAYGEWVNGPDRAAFEARVNARLAVNSFPWTPALGTYRISAGAAPAPNASEYLAATDLLMGNLTTVVNGINYMLDPARGALAQASRRANAFLLGTPLASIVTNRTIVPVSLPVFSPAVDLPSGHPLYLLPLFAPPNETRWAFRGTIVASVFNSIDDCALAVPGVVALHDITDTPAGQLLVNATLSALVVGPTPAAPPTQAHTPGELFVQSVRNSAFSTQAAYAAALQRAWEVSATAVQAWTLASGTRVWRLTLVADVDAVAAAAATTWDALSVVVGALIYCAAALAAAVLLWGAVVCDIRRLARHERAMTAQHMAAKAVQVAYVFHELRVPLNSITLGLLDLAEDGDMPDVFRPLLRTLKAAADGMVVVISDMLDLSRMERGDFTIRPQPVLASSMATEAVQRMTPFASEFGVAIRADVSSVVGTAVWADPARVMQILTNLLSNAIKFSPHDGTGSVVLRVTQRPCAGKACAFAKMPPLAATPSGSGSPAHRRVSGAAAVAVAPAPQDGIRAHRVSDFAGGVARDSAAASASAIVALVPPSTGAGGVGTGHSAASRGSSVRSSGVYGVAPGPGGLQHCHLVFEVEDNGCGIPSAEVDKLFKPFVQLAAGEAYKGRGTGLGLAITRNIAARHQGVMAVRSQEGVGSVFSLDLHVAVVDAATAGLVDSGSDRETHTRASHEPTSPANDATVGMHDSRRRWRVGRIGAEATTPTAVPHTMAGAGAMVGLMEQAPTARADTAAVGVTATTEAGTPPFLTAQLPPVVVDGSALPTGPSVPDVTDGVDLHTSGADVSGGAGTGTYEADWINVSMTSAVASTAPTGAGVSPTTLRRRWLMVDDVETNVKLLTRLLQRRCREDEFVVVYSGAAAMAELSARGVGGFDIIVSDKEMPSMDGHEVARRARAAGFRGVLLGCTGNATAADRDLFMAAGADDVVFKPVDVGALLRLVDELQAQTPGEEGGAAAATAAGTGAWGTSGATDPHAPDTPGHAAASGEP